LAFRMYGDEHKILGKSFWYSRGGMDLKFPHHECEIHRSLYWSNSC
jgi:cysteinyl-tRNA synthetase